MMYASLSAFEYLNEHSICLTKDKITKKRKPVKTFVLAIRGKCNYSASLDTGKIPLLGGVAR